MALQKWTFISGTDDTGLRLDQLVAKRTGLSRRSAREALKLGGVQADRKRVRVAGKMVQAGIEIRVAFDPDLPAVPTLHIQVVFEDQWLLVVNKPAGIPTQGTWASDRHDLMALIKTQRPDLKLFLHHRLDQGTSGLLIFSKDASINAELTRKFTEHGVRKTYLARVSRPLEACTVNRPIGRLRNAVPGRFGVEGDLMEPKEALTTFRPATQEECADLPPGHWIIAEPRTGRTHQIRVHLASLGAPVRGDRLYGGEEAPELELHAWKLVLDHPSTGKEIEFLAPPRWIQG
ncbi:MAG: RluA family pseudouridine synthase [Holophagaceae bacterium]|nr:RluA family pseudouridine synthase [Holophagaceae bacterium]